MMTFPAINKSRFLFPLADFSTLYIFFMAYNKSSEIFSFLSLIDPDFLSFIFSYPKALIPSWSSLEVLNRFTSNFCISNNCFKVGNNLIEWLTVNNSLYDENWQKLTEVAEVSIILISWKYSSHIQEHHFLLIL